MEKFLKLERELLEHKYRYYVLFNTTISDYDYDMLERKWFQMGEDLGINMDTYLEHWVGFSENHPMAKEVMEKLGIPKDGVFNF